MEVIKFWAIKNPPKRVGRRGDKARQGDSK